MKAYHISVMVAMGLSLMCAACDEGAMSGTGGAGGSCASSTSGATGGSGGSSPMCATPKQIRLLEEVVTTGTDIEVRYDSLDRREPRITDMELPTTELSAGDFIEVDPIDQVYSEKILVKSVDVIQDVNTTKYHRTFTGTFTKPHILNAPGTTPIADGCPAFVMPVQEVCDTEGAEFYVGATCWQPTCQYGEWVLIQQPDGTPCAWKDSDGKVGLGTCKFDGVCFL